MGNVNALQLFFIVLTIILGSSVTIIIFYVGARLFFKSFFNSFFEELRKHKRKEEETENGEKEK